MRKVVRAASYRSTHATQPTVHLAAGGPEAVEGTDAFNLTLVVVPAGEDFVLGHSGDGLSNLMEEGTRALHKHGGDGTESQTKNGPLSMRGEARC